MNIILFIDSLGGGGAQRQLANLAIGLQKREYNVTVLTYAPFENFLANIEAAGVQYECLHKGSRFDLTPAWKLAKRIRTIKPGIVIAFLRTPSMYAQFARVCAPSVPLLVSERGGIINDKLRLTEKTASVMHLSASGVIANSQAYASGMTAFFPPIKKRTQVIYNGVDPLFFDIGAKRIVQATTNVPVSKKSNDTSTTKFCVVSARPTVQKGTRILIQSLSMLLKAGHTNFTVDWIGPADKKNEEVQQLNAMLTENSLDNNWTWLGHQSNISECYKHYDALICPSLLEGVPNVMCEAMACALPVIATNVGDNHHIIEKPKHGLRCEPADAGELAQCIIQFLALNQTQRDQMGEAAHQRAQTLFAMTHYIERWHTVIQNTL